MMTNKNRFSFMFAFVSLLFITPEAESQQQNALEKFKARHEVTKVSMGSNGIPTFLVGKLTPLNAKGTPQEITFQFFEENKDLYKMHEPAKELKVESVSKDQLNMTHIQLKQQYKGVEVYGREMITHFNSKGELQTVNGDFLTEINVPITPTVSQEVAEMVMMDDLRSNFGSVKPEVHKHQLLIYPFENKVHLVWDFFASFHTPTYGEWEYYIDAFNGDIVHKVNKIRFEQNGPVVPQNEKKIQKEIRDELLPAGKKKIPKKKSPIPNGSISKTFSPSTVVLTAVIYDADWSKLVDVDNDGASAGNVPTV